MFLCFLYEIFHVPFGCDPLYWAARPPSLVQGVGKARVATPICAGPRFGHYHTNRRRIPYSCVTASISHVLALNRRDNLASDGIHDGFGQLALVCLLRHALQDVIPEPCVTHTVGEAGRSLDFTPGALRVDPVELLAKPLKPIHCPLGATNAEADQVARHRRSTSSCLATSHFHKLAHPVLTKIIATGLTIRHEKQLHVSHLPWLGV